MKGLLSRHYGEKLSGKKDILKLYLKLIYEQGMMESYGGAHIQKAVAEREMNRNFEGSRILSFDRRISYFSDGLILGSREFCESKFRQFRSYIRTKTDRKAQLLKARFNRSRVSAPEGHLLHFHTIRTYSLE